MQVNNNHNSINTISSAGQPSFETFYILIIIIWPLINWTNRNYTIIEFLNYRA